MLGGGAVNKEKILEQILELFQQLKGSEEAVPEVPAEGEPKAELAVEVLPDEKKGIC